MKTIAPNWKPHPPASAEWPDYVVKMYHAGCEKIDRLRKQFDEDGILPMPFTCYGCEEPRTDLAMMTGDGLPMCVKCLGFDPAEVMEYADA